MREATADLHVSFAYHIDAQYINSNMQMSRRNNSAIIGNAVATYDLNDQLFIWQFTLNWIDLIWRMRKSNVSAANHFNLNFQFIWIATDEFVVV